MLDLIIKGSKIIDGTGSDAYKADVGIQGDRIALIGDLTNHECHETLDVTGKTLTPGFIDMHSHADQTVLAYPTMDSMIHQGITSFVGCQCGQSIAPVGKYWLGNQAELDILKKLTFKLYPDMYDEDYYTLTKDTVPYLRKEHGFDPSWTTFGQWLDQIDQHGLSGNIITLVGYSTIRMNVMGPDSNREPTKREAESLKSHLSEALQSGAFGMSTGLDYKPGIFSKTDELMHMVTALKPFSGIYFTHWRKTGLRANTPKRQSKIDGIREGLDIGLLNDIQVQLSHLSSGYDVFPADDDFMQVAAAERTMQVIDEYIKRGTNAHFDVIPNITGGTMIAPDLISLFKPWYYITGGIELFLRNLQFPDYRKSITDVIYTGQYFILNPGINPDWDDNIKILRCKKHRYEGKSIRQISLAFGKSSLESVFDILLIDPETKMFRATHSMNVHAVRKYLAHPEAMVGNDTFVFDLTSTVAYDPQLPGNKPNPNTYCGFVKYITSFGMPRLEDTIRKITGKPSQVLHLSDRGLIHVGFKADLNIIDVSLLNANENVIDPSVYPSGINHVLVNGRFVLKNGRLTGNLPGGVIRGQNR